MPFLVKRGPHFVSEPGVDYGGPGEIIAQNPQAIVVKWPRGRHWTANGAPYAYHPATTPPAPSSTPSDRSCNPSSSGTIPGQ